MNVFVFFICQLPGMALGGYVVKRFNMSCRQILFMCATLTFMTIPQTAALIIRLEPISISLAVRDDLWVVDVLSCTQCNFIS